MVLRLIAEHSPCAETYLLSRVTGGDPDDAANASASHAQGLICDALRKLKSLGFIEFIHEEIAITDDGRLFLEGIARREPEFATTIIVEAGPTSVACPMRATRPQRA